MNDEVMKAISVIVVHLEDPKGSGRAACNGVLFQSPYPSAREGDVLWFCTGCSVVTNRLQVYREAAEELGFTFDLRWKADMRAIKRWQAAHPGNDLVWPDHADMVVWLLGEVDRLLKEKEIIERVLGQGPLT